MMNNAWDLRFMELAQLVATWSKDPSTQVGCVLVAPDKRVVSLGYNGFPRGVEDSGDRYEDRPTKYAMIQHAEANAVLQATGPTAYTTAYVTAPPCSSCAGVLIQAHIRRVVTFEPSPALAERFAHSFACARVMFDEAGVSTRVFASR